MKEISLSKFISHFGENLRKEKRFCFILGAGASRSSKIPTGQELVQQWIKELKEFDESDLKKWLKEKGIAENDFASHYSDIFDKRFELSKKDGFAFLEKTMENVEPSCGYSVLAQILANGKHNIVITTNFDSLTEDALFIYTKKKPLMIGHASLADYISTNLSRPLVVKIHNDLLLSPKNSVDDVACLDSSFDLKLKDIFKYYTPLFIGYGGNDGSLMNFLEKLDHFEEGIFWFYINGNTPKQRIIDLVEKQKGCFVPINGFDDLMIQLGNKLELEKLDTTIEQIAKNRADSYRKQIEAITKNITTDYETKEAMTSIASRGEKTWWNYNLLASQEKNVDKANEIYKQGIKEFPKSIDLLCSYGVFLYVFRKQYDEAEKCYLNAMEIDPENADVNFYYANFLTLRKQYDLAEKYYLKALEIQPDDAHCNCNFAAFNSDIRKRYDEAEKYYLRALKIDPENANCNGNYAKHLIICNRRDDAILHINKAFEYYEEEDNALCLELWFYCYAIFPDLYPQSKEKIEELLAKGIISIGWDLSEILRIAKEDNHPDYEQLVEFAKKITEV